MARTFTGADILAKNSKCVINLNGGKITTWIAMSDSTAAAKNGYENGIIINIGENFKLADSFRASIDKQENNVIDKVFYGISGDSVYVEGNQIAIGASKVYIASAKYNEYKDSDRFHGIAVEEGTFNKVETPDSSDMTWVVAAIAMVAMAGAVLTFKKKKVN